MRISIVVCTLLFWTFEEFHRDFDSECCNLFVGRALRGLFIYFVNAALAIAVNSKIGLTSTSPPDVRVIFFWWIVTLTTNIHCLNLIMAQRCVYKRHGLVSNRKPPSNEKKYTWKTLATTGDHVATTGQYGFFNIFISVKAYTPKEHKTAPNRSKY